MVVEKPVSEKKIGQSAGHDSEQEKGTTTARPDRPSAEPNDDVKEPSAVVAEMVNSEPTLHAGQKDTVTEEVRVLDILMQFARSPRLLTCFAVLFITT